MRRRVCEAGIMISAWTSITCLLLFPVLVLWLPVAVTADPPPSPDDQNVPEKVCYVGYTTFHQDPVWHYRKLQQRYQGCTQVIGNLVIADLQNPYIDYDMSFLKDIRYVSGFVAIYTNWYPGTVSLPRLEIIRGNSTFNEGNAAKGLGNISLLVTASEHLHVYMPNLKEVSSGNVLIDLETCPLLCHLDTIDWSSIVRDGQVQLSTNNATCPPCSQECQQHGRGQHCWGPEADLCQHLKDECSVPCENGLCVAGNGSQCCASECAIGCHGPSALECTACRDYIIEFGICSSFCPLNPTHVVNGQDCIATNFELTEELN